MHISNVSQQVYSNDAVLLGENKTVLRTQEHLC